jgi:hypothetical protein
MEHVFIIVGFWICTYNLWSISIDSKLLKRIFGIILVANVIIIIIIILTAGRILNENMSLKYKQT